MSEQTKTWTAASMGRKGGSRRVEKGLAKVGKRRRTEIGKLGALARWGKKPAQKEANSGPGCGPEVFQTTQNKEVA